MGGGGGGVEKWRLKLTSAKIEVGIKAGLGKIPPPHPLHTNVTLYLYFS